MEEGMMKVFGSTQNAFIISHMFMLHHLFNPLTNLSKPIEPVDYKPGILEMLRDLSKSLGSPSS
jgi:hypothetical protein